MRGRVPLLGEVLGRLLWQASDPGVRFVGAMVATACAWIGLYVLTLRLVRRWSKQA